MIDFNSSSINNIYLNDTNTNEQTNSSLMIIVFKIISIIPLIIIFIGVTGNLTSFLIFRLEKELRQMSSMVYLSFCCITDTLSLFTWNLNHFLRPNFNFGTDELGIHYCRFFQFIQYFSLQSSALILAAVCVDRYFSVISTPGSFISKLPFGTVKSATIISSIIVTIIALSNSFILFTDRLEIYQNETIIYNNLTYFQHLPVKYDCDTLPNGYKIYPDYETVHIIIYPTLAVIIMFIFNTLLIIKIVSIKKSRSSSSNNNNNSNNKMINLTVSLLFITFLFVLMCLPGTFAYKYFGDYFYSTNELKAIIYSIDSLSFLNRSSIFINCMISNVKFRSTVLRKLNKLFRFSSNQNNYNNNNNRFKYQTETNYNNNNNTRM